jgi:D-alanine-D-alanine ligase-like ATP-grasp enzyme
MGRKQMISVPVIDETIPHEAMAKYGASIVMLKPAAQGRGMIASNTVRTVLELAGVRNVISKSLGSQNRINVARATILALTSLRLAEQVAMSGARSSLLRRPVMQLKELRPVEGATHSSRRVGRGNGSGRGITRPRHEGPERTP